MERLRSFNRTLDHLIQKLLACLFGGMIVVVFLQVFARNVLEIPLIWTLDIAQLLFSWSIFIGAALALRWNAHYNLDLIPKNWTMVDALLTIICHLGSIVVVALLVHNGTIFADIGLTRTAVALGISEFWFFLPIPLGGVCMALFLIETIPTDMATIWKSLKENRP